MPALRDRSPRSFVRRLGVALGLATALPVAGAETVFCEGDDFRNRSFVSGQAISNFANVGFNDQASSAVIRSGSWQPCADACFRGRCVTLGPGDCPTLPWSLNNKISSGRRIHDPYSCKHSPNWQR